MSPSLRLLAEASAFTKPWNAWADMEERKRWNEYKAEMRKRVPPHLRGSLWYRRNKAAYKNQYNIKIDSFADSTGMGLSDKLSNSPFICVDEPNKEPNTSV